jgi:hypothetical protein
MGGSNVETGAAGGCNCGGFIVADHMKKPARFSRQAFSIFTG